MNTSGQISGNPPAAAANNITVQVKDSKGATAANQLAVIIVTPGSLDGPAILPTAKINTTIPSQPSANALTVTAGSASDLQAKINTAASNCGSTGAIVSVPAGAAYTTSSYFNLPQTNCDASHWVVIESASLSSLPAQGTRVGSANVTNMPTLGTSAPNQWPVILAADNPSSPPSGYWLAGLEVTDDPDPTGAAQIALVMLGDYCNQTGSCTITGTMSSTNLASRFTVDRCYIHGATSTPTHGVRQGIYFTASDVAIEDSTITNIAAPGYETHGINTTFSFGPVDIGNSTVEAASINVFFGGTDPTIPNTVTSDIYIHQNYLHKLDAWLPSGSGYLTKDVLECKNCQRMLAEGNLFAGDYDSGLNYVSFQLSPRNAYGKCTWCVVQDVTFRYNWMSNVTGFLSILGANHSPCPNASAPGCDSNWQNEYLSVGSLPTKRVSVHDNVGENVTGPILKFHVGLPSVCPVSGIACRVSDISIAHNSIVSDNPLSPVIAGSPLTAHHFIFSEKTGETPQNDAGYNLTIKNNILPCNNYCMETDDSLASSQNCTQPTQTCGFAVPLNAYFIAPGGGTIGWVYTNNAITGLVTAGWVASDLPVQNSDNSSANNFQTGLPPDMTGIGFTNWNSGTGGNYQLLSTSLFHNAADDGTDVGANINVVNSYITGVLQGTPVPH